MWARIIDNNGVQTVAEVIDWNPEGLPDDIRAQFVPVEPGMVYRAEKRNGVWVAPPEPELVPTPEPVAPTPERRTVFAPPQFMLLLTPSERVAIRSARAYDGPDANKRMVAAVIDDWLSILDDPRLVSVSLDAPATAQGLQFLVDNGMMTAERRQTILNGGV